ncbi:MAG: lysophospholipid acyltransferase family protein [Chitinophagales bacterium]
MFQYLIFRTVIFFISNIPFALVYRISDMLSWLFFYVIKYRKKVVFANLRASFPTKSEAEITAIARKFYTNLSDILLESFKAFTMSKADFLERYKILNPEVSQHYFEKNQGVIVAGGHYTNWEWLAICSPLQVVQSMIGFYKPLANTRINDFVAQSRSQFGMGLASIYETNKTFQTFMPKAHVFVMIGDQSPSNVTKSYWIKFLNQDTACLHGIEQQARTYNCPIVYFDAQRTKRGYYEMTLIPIIEKPLELADGEITAKYMRKLEQIILEKPENWLWSHKRWKKKRQ